MMTLRELNAMNREAFVNTLGGIYEHSSWIAEAVFGQRPFVSFASLQTAMRLTVDNSTDDERLVLLRSHPEFAGEAAVRGELTDASNSEQGSLSLQKLPPEQHRRMQELNRQFMHKFGFPGIVAVRKQKSVEDIFNLLEHRLHNDIDNEMRDAIAQVHLIAECRLSDLVVTE